MRNGYVPFEQWQQMRAGASWPTPLPVCTRARRLIAGASRTTTTTRPTTNNRWAPLGGLAEGGRIRGIDETCMKHVVCRLDAH